MKKSKLLTSLSKVFQFLVCGGLAASGNALAQTSPGGTVSIDQIGSSNTAIVSSQGNGNQSVVTQNGSGNMATVIQNGIGNGAVSGSVDQAGDNNETDIEIEGDDNSYTVMQTSDGATNASTFTQTGNLNNIDIVQDATGLTEGLANYAEVAQLGNGNHAGISQTSLEGGLAEYNNSAIIYQTGDDNLATTEQNGRNNKSEQEQVGDRNTSSILQNGDDNIAIHRQFGDDLSVPSELGLHIEQTGGATISVIQYGEGYVPPPPPG